MDTIVIINLLKLILTLTDFYSLLLFLYAVMSFLGLMGLINLSDGLAARIFFFINSLVQPPLQFIGRYVPRKSMLDIAFLILVVLLWIIGDICSYYINYFSNTSFDF